MFVTNGPNTIAHADADCHCSSCKQSRKPDKIVALPSLMLRQGGNCVNESANMRPGGGAAAQSRGNVIPISAATRFAGQLRPETVEQAKFNYPMLECS